MRILPLDIPESSQPERYTISSPASGQGRYIRQTSSADSFGVITLRLEPYRGLEPFVLVWQVTEEQIPSEFIPAVIAGIQQAVHQERMVGGGLTHIQVVVVDGAFHPVDSHARAYLRATRLAFDRALAGTSRTPFIETA